MRRFLDMGYSVVKMKIGGTDLAEDLKRIEAVLEVLDGDGSRLAVDVNGRFDLQTALDYGRAIEPYGLFWYEEIGDPLDYRAQRHRVRALQRPDRHRREPVLRPGRPQPDPLRRDAPRPRLHPGRPRAELRPHRIPAGPGHAARSTAGPHAAASPTADTSSRCTSPQPSSSAATSPTRASSSPPAASPTTPSSPTARSGSPRSPASASKARAPSTRCCANCTTDRPLFGAPGVHGRAARTSPLPGHRPPPSTHPSRPATPCRIAPKEHQCHDHLNHHTPPHNGDPGSVP